MAKEPITKPVKTTNPVPVVNPNPTPQKPKIPLYKGGNGNGGNGADQDNGYKTRVINPAMETMEALMAILIPMETHPAESHGGPRVTGDRHIVRYYSFTGDLEKATIYAL